MICNKFIALRYKMSVFWALWFYVLAKKHNIFLLSSYEFIYQKLMSVNMRSLAFEPLKLTVNKLTYQ